MILRAGLLLWAFHFKQCSSNYYDKFLHLWSSLVLFAHSQFINWWNWSSPLCCLCRGACNGPLVKSSFFNSRLLGYCFNVRLGWFWNILSENSVLMALLSYSYLLAHTITFILNRIKGDFFNPLQSTYFLRTMTWL